jgi:hypothetical protein
VPPLSADETKAIQRARELLARMELEGKLETKVSVAVRNASADDIAKAVRQAGLPIRVEVRGVPFVPITLSVRDVTARSVLTAAALFSGCELFVLQDHLLITSKESRTQEEARFSDQDFRTQYLKSFLQTIAYYSKRQGKEDVTMAELDPFMQQVTQRLADIELHHSTLQRVKLAPDTHIHVTIDRDDEKVFKCTVEIVGQSQGVHTQYAWADVKPVPVQATDQRRPQ